MIVETLVAVLIPTIILLVLWSRNAFRYFKDKGIKHQEPVFLFGNALPMVLMRRNQMEIWEDLCLRKFPQEPIVGYYNFIKPIYICANADYIEKILIKDFTHFIDHGFEEVFKKSQNPYDETLFTMTGKRWKAFRYKLSPLFTTGKLKGMFTCMVNCCEGLVKFLNEKPNKDVNMQPVAGIFSMDVMGSSIFGIESKLLENPDCEYHRMGKRAFDMNFFDFIKMIMLTMMPAFVVRLLGLTFNKKDVIEYFSKTVNDTFKYRREHNVQRNDLIQLLLQLKEKGKIEIQHWDPNDDYLKNDEAPVESYEVTDEILAVQAFSFLIAGYDGLSLAMTYTCFELAQNMEIQEKIRKEILEKVKLHSSLDYEACKAMTYLENAVKETLRLHPVAPFLMRTCTSSEYKFPNGITLKEGNMIQIPLRAVHLNPEYHKDPKCFRPERFEEPMIPGSYIPFGDGPRMCLAMRFVLLHVKIGVATILMNYRVKLNPKTELPLQIKPLSFFTTPKKDIIFDLEPIKS